MMKNRITLKKRCASVLLMLMMLFTFMPVLGGQQAFAGGGTDIDGIINGLSGDGTVSAGMTLTVNIADFNDKYGGDFKTPYENGEVSAGWSITKDGFAEPEFVAGYLFRRRFQLYGRGEIRGQMDKI